MPIICRWNRLFEPYNKAFAVDSAGHLGGCTWPPRSYSCSFCRREFKSAQALGGHMNVHRRDRARLKQSPSPQNEIPDHLHQQQPNHDLLQNPSLLLDVVQYPSRICSFNLYHDPNRYHDSDHGSTVLGSSFSPSRVSTQPIKEDCSQKTTLVHPMSSPIVQESTENKASIFGGDQTSEIYLPFFEKKSSEVLESRCRAKRDYVKADLSVSLNLVVCHNCPNVSISKEETTACSKRRRTTDAALLPLFPKDASGSVDRNHLQQEVFELSYTTSMEDLDLELRLGN